MKKLLAVLSVVGVATLITGCSDDMKINTTNNYVKNINDFKEQVTAYSKINSNQNTKVILGKYKLSTSIDNNEIKEDLQKTNLNENMVEDENETKISINNEQNNNKLNLDEPIIKIEDLPSDYSKPQNNNQENEETLNKDTSNEKISTLYSITNDIDNCCEDFITLKQNLTNAIVETQNLINKVNSKEIELNNEQKLLIIEQSKQLKDLARKLSTITTELSISLSDLNSLMLNDGNLDTLSLKYLIVLDNLVNGNEMLENGLHSLNLINNMFNTSAPLPPNNTGRILYGFRRNNEDPVIKDYLIDKNGNLVENEQNQPEKNAENQNSQLTETKTIEDQNGNEAKNESKKNNIDTMQNNSLNTNIDSYRNHNQNIDSFFNTALLDNEFMYGNGYGNPYGAGMGNGLIYGNGINDNAAYYQNSRTIPNNNQYSNQNNNFINTTNYGVDNSKNTQQNENNPTYQTNSQRKKFKFKNNIDTYKDANTPSLSTRFGKVKKSISGFFNKFSKKKENTVFNGKKD